MEVTATPCRLLLDDVSAFERDVWFVRREGGDEWGSKEAIELGQWGEDTLAWPDELGEIL